MAKTTDEKVADIMALGDGSGLAWDELTELTTAFQAEPNLTNTEALLDAGSRFAASFGRWLMALDALSGDLEVADTHKVAEQSRIIDFVDAMIASEGEDCGPAPSLPLDPDNIRQWVPRG